MLRVVLSWLLVALATSHIGYAAPAPGLLARHWDDPKPVAPVNWTEFIVPIWSPGPISPWASQNTSSNLSSPAPVSKPPTFRSIAPVFIVDVHTYENASALELGIAGTHWDSENYEERERAPPYWSLYAPLGWCRVISYAFQQQNGTPTLLGRVHDTSQNGRIRIREM
jgi:hypothetical protein